MNEARPSRGAGDPDSSFIPKGLVGMSNLGNTCYMNAALQCLLNTPALTDFFLTCSKFIEVEKHNSMAKAYKKLVSDVWASGHSRGYMAPTGVLYAIKSAYPMFRGFHQHDSQEFLRCIMDLLHEELSEPVNYLEEDEDDQEEMEQDNDAEEDQDRYAIPFVEGASPIGSDNEEYETADSGVSERSSCTSSAASDEQADVKRNVKEQDDVTSEKPDSMEECSTRPTSVSDVDLEFVDAISSQSSGSPPSPKQLDGSPIHVQKRKPKTYRSIISDIFDGKLISSVQCLSCNRVSMTTEAFQDLSLPIPSQETISALRTQKNNVTPFVSPSQEGWLSWAWSWMFGWFSGPTVTLVDCLSYFFSADELKGENMYSCERCKLE